jgi:hypothetical protein
MSKIAIPRWLKEENPITAGFCELINECLDYNPKMSLADFATLLSETNIERSMQRIQKAEEKQFSGGAYVL